ncbi:hypothetical protein [Helicobacter pylori]|uniref:hypothetical protein n=1 Tax=Helicobacter pylori TaxID=210 RepID=UPI001E341942|nr:hypothetical protein [Helicobacter pylori]
MATLKGALKYQWTKSTLGLYSATRQIAGVKLSPKQSHSASDFREFKGIYDFTHYFLMVDREANK